MKLRPILLPLLAAVFTVPAAAQEPAAEAPATLDGLRIDINIPENVLRVIEGDEVVRTYRISVGKPGHDTPDGDFTIGRAEWNPSWRPPPGREWTRGREYTPPGPNNPMGRVKLFFAPLYYIHGTPDASEIGQPASHGCVRMANADVIALARLLHERAQPTVPPTAIAGILRQATTTRWSTFRTPVELTIRYEPIVVEDGNLRVFPDVYDRNRVHTEGVIQALLSAGYDVRGLDRQQIRAVLARAARARGTFSVPVAEAFGDLAMANAPALAAGR